MYRARDFNLLGRLSAYPRSCCLQGSDLSNALASIGCKIAVQSPPPPDHPFLPPPPAAPAIMTTVLPAAPSGDVTLPAEPGNPGSATAVADACTCSRDGHSGTAVTPLIDCAQHGLGVGDTLFYCMVAGGVAGCPSATPSKVYPGAAWMPCSPLGRGGEQQQTAVMAYGDKNGDGNGSSGGPVGGWTVKLLQKLFSSLSSG